QLVEVIDEGQPLLVPDRRQSCHAATAKRLVSRAARFVLLVWRRCRGGALRRHGGLSAGRQLRPCGRLVVILVAPATADRVLELAHSTAQLTTQLRQALGTEDDQQDDKDQQQL